MEFDWKTFRGTQSSWKGMDYFQRPQDRPYTESKEDVIQGACVWGTICNASAGMGSIVAEAYGNSPWAIFVGRIPNPQAAGPEGHSDLGRLARRQPFQRALPAREVPPLAHIKTVNTGGFGARLKALLEGEVEAASLLPPQIDMAEQLGLRKVIEDRFHTLWWVPGNAAADVVQGYMNALQRAEEALEADLPKYLPLWRISIPGEFEDFHPWDFSKFTRGEKFVNKPLSQTEFDDTLEQVKRWGLDQHLKEIRLENLVHAQR